MNEWSENLYLKFHKPIVNFFKELGISPNSLTIFNIILTLTLGTWWFSRGTYIGFILGTIVCIINGIIDYIDGDLAKSTNQCSSLGAWLDSGFDVMIQTIVMGAIALGCFKQGMNIMWVLLFFIGIVGSNLVSAKFNSTFGFDSHRGNELFRKFMDTKPSKINILFKNIIDPTASPIGLILFTVRYFIVIGALFNIMPICFIVLTFITNLRWIFMFVIYGMHLKYYKNLWLLKALSTLDTEREEFYALRNSQKV